MSAPGSGGQWSARHCFGGLARDYRDVLYRAAELFAPGQRIVLLADRGFCDVEAADPDTGTMKSGRHDLSGEIVRYLAAFTPT